MDLRCFKKTTAADQRIHHNCLDGPLVSNSEDDSVEVVKKPSAQVEDGKPSAQSSVSDSVDVLEISAPAQNDKHKVKRMRTVARKNTFPKTPHHELTRAQKTIKARNLSAFEKYGRAIRNDVTEIVEGDEDNWNVGKSQEYHNAYLNMYFPVEDSPTED